MPKLLLIFLTLFISYRSYSQGFSFLYSNVYYNDSVGYINPNSIWSVYPDNNKIFANVNIGSPNRAYVSAHDYNGNQIFLKKIPYPEDKLYLTFSAYIQSNTITKINDNIYLSAGFGYDWLTLKDINGSVDRPYLYFFDSNGDSLSFLMPLWFGIKRLKLTAVTYDSLQNEIVVTGYGSSDTGKVEYNPTTKEYYMHYDYICYWAAKFTDKGELIWFKEINLMPKYMYIGGIPQPYRILPTTDSGYMICGQGRKVYPDFDGEKINMNNISFVPALTKIDKDGNLLWHKHLPRDSFPAHASGVISRTAVWDLCSDGANGFYFVSNAAAFRFSDSALNYYSDVYYYGRLNSNGDTLWTKTFTPDTSKIFLTNNICRQQNGDLVIGGSLSTLGWDPPPIRPLVFYTDSLGNVKWYREPRHFDDYSISNRIFTMSLAPNGNIIGGGMLGIGSQSYHPEAKVLKESGINMPGWLFMLDSNGYRCVQDTDTVSGDYPCHEPYHIPPDTASGKYVNVKVYPIPARDILYIELQGERHKNTNRYTAYLCDITGRPLMQGIIENRKQAINLSALSSGIYILRITKDGELIGTYKVSKI